MRSKAAFDLYFIFKLTVAIHFIYLGIGVIILFHSIGGFFL